MPVPVTRLISRCLNSIIPGREVGQQTESVNKGYGSEKNSYEKGRILNLIMVIEFIVISF